MIRLLAIAFLVSLLVRVVFGRWPWDYMQTPPTRAQQVFRARKLLDLTPDASEADIRAAHRRKLAVIHPDRGGSTELAQELNAARDLLLAERILATEPD